MIKLIELRFEQTPTSTCSKADAALGSLEVRLTSRYHWNVPIQAAPRALAKPYTADGCAQLYHVKARPINGCVTDDRGCTYTSCEHRGTV